MATSAWKKFRRSLGGESALQGAIGAMARERGVTVSINTDAHNVRQLDYMLFGVATAKRGWVPPEQVLNALPWEALRKRLGL